MSQNRVKSSDVLKALRLNRSNWEDLKAVAVTYAISRTHIVNLLIEDCISTNKVPGYVVKPKTEDN